MLCVIKILILCVFVWARPACGAQPEQLSGPVRLYRACVTDTTIACFNDT